MIQETVSRMQLSPMEYGSEPRMLLRISAEDVQLRLKRGALGHNIS
jgi:hypothetical protein